MRSNTKGYVYAFISTFLFACGYIINFFILQAENTESAAFLVFGMSALMAIVLTGIYFNKKDMKSVRIYWKHMAALGVINGLGSIFWFQTLDSLGPSVSGFLFRFTTIFTIMMGVFFLKERFNKAEAAGMLFIVGGAFIITYADISLATGVMLAAFSSLCFAAMGLISKLCLKNVRPMMLNNARIIVIFIVIAVYALLTGNMRIYSLNSVILASLTAFFVVITGMILYFKAIRCAELSKIALIAALEPLFVLLLSFLILQHVPTLIQMLGGFVIMAGMGVILYYRKKPAVVVED